MAVHDMRAADRLTQRIISAVDRLSRYPLSGAPRLDIASNARSLSVARYTILHRIGDNEVEIVRVVHSARNLADIDF